MKRYLTLTCVLLVLSATSFSQTKQFRSNLFIVDPNGNTVLMDGTLSMYHVDFSNEVNNQDARKMFNPGENIGIERDGKVLIIERREEITSSDTIFLKLWNTRIITYQLQLVSKYFSDAGVSGVLFDHYLNTTTEIDFDTGTYYNFSVTADPASKRTDRFMIVFKPSVAHGMLSLDFVDASASFANRQVALHWTTANEQLVKDYTVERSSDGREFHSAGLIVPASNRASNEYTIADSQPLPGISFYRIKATDADGKITYSKALKVAAATVKASVSVYPNPTTSSNVKLHISGQVPGHYRVTVLNNTGRILHSQTEQLGSGSAQISIQSNQPLPHGIYRIEVTGPDGFRSTHNLLIAQ